MPKKFRWMFSWSLTKWTIPRHPLKCVAAGSGLVGLPPKSPIKGVKKVYLFMGMAPKVKAVPSVTLGFHEYGITNAKHFRSGISPASNPQRVRKRGNLFIGMTPTLKTMSNLSLGFPEYGMTNASNFNGRSSLNMEHSGKSLPVSSWKN